MALFKLSSLQQQLAESVPCAEMDKANQQYNQLVIKYQQLLSQQTAYTATTASVEQLQVCTIAYIVCITVNLVLIILQA